MTHRESPLLVRLLGLDRFAIAARLLALWIHDWFEWMGPLIMQRADMPEILDLITLIRT